MAILFPNVVHDVESQTKNDDSWFENVGKQFDNMLCMLNRDTCRIVLNWHFEY